MAYVMGRVEIRVVETDSDHSDLPLLALVAPVAGQAAADRRGAPLDAEAQVAAGTVAAVGLVVADGAIPVDQQVQVAVLR